MGRWGVDVHTLLRLRGRGCAPGHLQTKQTLWPQQDPPLAIAKPPRGLVVIPPSSGGAKFSWSGLTLAMETLKTSGGIDQLWINFSFGFSTVAFPTSTFWPLMVYNMVHGVTSACKDMSAT